MDAPILDQLDACGIVQALCSAKVVKLKHATNYVRSYLYLSMYVCMYVYFGS